MAVTMGVSNVPGQTALIRIPRGAYSRAALLVSLLDHGGDLLLVGIVASDTEDLIPARPQPCGGGLQGLVVDVGQDDRGSGLCERRRRAPASSLRPRIARS
jgi:hypothetical protein